MEKGSGGGDEAYDSGDGRWAADHVTIRLGAVFPFGCIRVRQLNIQLLLGVVSSLSTTPPITRAPFPVAVTNPAPTGIRLLFHRVLAGLSRL
jgi:hypothetical protein